MQFTMLPNEGNLNLQDIRNREYGEKISESPVLEEHIELDYDKDFRFTHVRSIEELHFAFIKKEQV